MFDANAEALRLLALPYARVFIPEETGFSTRILEFPGCFSQGETLQEAYDNLESAAHGWLLACLIHGTPVPPPQAVSS